mmetsp:Transcript_22527/g.58183  ORF Transcript_22527/g.58183 Transcript_22527/m.58183 type:complete len:110 (+) Transcript_22527:316-645(+)
MTRTVQLMMMVVMALCTSTSLALTRGTVTHLKHARPHFTARQLRGRILMRYNRKTDSYDNAVQKGDRRYVSASGVVYAPWMDNQVDDKATAKSKKQRELTARKVCKSIP